MLMQTKITPIIGFSGLKAETDGYKDLEIEIQKMWHLKTQTVPVIVVALGMIRKGTEKLLAKLPGSPSLGEIKKIVLTSTARIL